MPEITQRIALAVPGLCGLDLPGDFLAKRPLALETLLTRSQVTQHATAFERTIGAFFASDEADMEPPPVAPLCWLGDSGQGKMDYMLRADPVHLRADQARLLLFDSHVLSIQAQEAAALVDAFNQHYAERGWHLEAPLPQRWYLSLPDDPEIETVPPLELVGQDIDRGLPRGKQAGQWHALLNEIQMLFHDHPVNQAREQRGEPAINSVWVWGGGRLPRQMHSRVARVFSDQPYARGLARLAEVKVCGLPAAAEDLLLEPEPGLTLVVIASLEHPALYTEAEVWAESLLDLERRWFEPLRKALERGRLAALDIYPVNGRRYGITRRRLWQFWKRPRPIARHCHHD